MSSSNPFQQPPLTTIHACPPTAYFHGYEKDGIHFNHHFVNAHNSLAPPPAVTDHAMAARQQPQLSRASCLHKLCDDCTNPFESLFYPPEKKTPDTKKDGHSKIHTAQGPRGRRVRLSIEVSKRFFYLQDMLGFDTASKTLDWLFAKSKTEIKGLETKKRGSEKAKKGKNKKSRSKCSEAKKEKPMPKNKSGVDVNQSREAARARARERTKEKKENKKIDHSCVTPQSSFWSQIEQQNECSNLHVYSDSSSQIKYASFPNMQ